MSTILQEKILKEIDHLSEQQLMEVLLFIEFLNSREDEDFIDYVNRRTQLAVADRKKGKKFYNLTELQREFSES